MAQPSLPRVAGDFAANVLLFGAAVEEQRPDAATFRSQVTGALDAISAHPAAQGLAPDELDNARFALVAWTDEVVLRSDWAGRDEWLHDLLQLSLFRTNRAGDEFYQRLAALPPEQNTAREIFFLCLALGFEGQLAGNEPERQNVMRQQYEMLRVAGRAQDVAAATPIAAPAYEVAIELPKGAGSGLRRILFGWSGVAIAFFVVAWSILTCAAAQVPTPPGS